MTKVTTTSISHRLPKRADGKTLDFEMLDAIIRDFDPKTVSNTFVRLAGRRVPVHTVEGDGFSPHDLLEYTGLMRLPRD